jgi:hypothetical protein
MALAIDHRSNINGTLMTRLEKYLQASGDFVAAAMGELNSGGRHDEYERGITGERGVFGITSKTFGGEIMVEAVHKRNWVGRQEKVGKRTSGVG